MPRNFPHAVCAALAAMTVVFSLSAVAMAARGQTPGQQSVDGRLAFVEPDSRRVVVVPDGEVELMDFFVEDTSEVHQGEQELTLSELVVQVGRRVTVIYRVEHDRRIAQNVIVEMG